MRRLIAQGPLIILTLFLFLTIPGCKYNIASKPACRIEMVQGFRSTMDHLSWEFDGRFQLCHGLSNQELRPLAREAMHEAIQP